MEKKFVILLTGSNGNLGCAIKNELKKKYSNTKFFTKKNLNFINLSLIEKYLNKIKPKFIINTAAYTDVNRAEIDKKNCYIINALAPKKIADWAYKNNAFLIHFSTDYVFNGKNKKPLTEKDKPRPINFYGKSKFNGEKFIINSKCKYFILRVGWLYSEKKENFPQKIIKKILKENKILVINDQIGVPNHVSFVSKITIKILKKIISNPKTTSRILHVSAKGYTSYYNWAKKIQKKSVKLNNCQIIPVSYKSFKTKIKRPLNSIFNSNELEKFLEYKLPNWETIFQKKISEIIKKSIN